MNKEIADFIRAQQARDDALRQSFALFADAQKAHTATVDRLADEVGRLANEVRDLRKLLDL